MRLNDKLSTAFSRAHHVGRVDRFIGRDEYQIFNAGVDRRLDNLSRTKNVVQDAGDNVGFNQGHVLIRGGVIDRLD